MIFRSADRLDPVRRLGPPRLGTLLRVSLVAVLLCLAAAALYADPGAGPGVATSPAPSPGTRLPLPVGLVGVPIRLADAAPLEVLGPGDRVDLVALPGGGQPAGGGGQSAGGGGQPAAGGAPEVLASGALVLHAIAGPETPVLYLALTDAQARTVLATAPDVRFGVIVRSR